MDNDISSDNIRSTVFDHYAQLFLIQKYNSKNDKETYNHNFKTFNKDSFEREYFEYIN